MKKIHALILALLVLNLPQQAGAVCADLTEHDIGEAREFAETHKQNTGIVLNNTYRIGENKLFTEHVIIRTKWHKLALLYMVKTPGSELTGAEKETVLGDPNLQIDIILFGHSLDFAEGYQALISQNDLSVKARKIAADHFQLGHYKSNIYSGFPAYSATLRTYFNLASFDSSKPFTLILIRSGHEKSFVIDLRNFR